jgi:hypothetical protein
LLYLQTGFIHNHCTKEITITEKEQSKLGTKHPACETIVKESWNISLKNHA